MPLELRFWLPTTCGGFIKPVFIAFFLILFRVIANRLTNELSDPETAELGIPTASMASLRSITSAM